MKQINKDKENINTLLQLIKENPELPILPMVATEAVCDDSFSYWMAKWGRAKVDKYWCDDERVYSYNENFDSLVDEWIDDNYEDYPNFTDEELQKKAESVINGYEWVEAIIVYIDQI